MSSLKTKSTKTKPLTKSSKAIKTLPKTHISSLKQNSFSFLFKNLEIETTCELPTIEEEKPELEA